ncbi:MAG: hypothetical protein CSB47_02290 [Proteobacteria bacterium]|nr:MAG: hypothetical protein CSB47_02290 [Pseudomonadota bacterium]
MKKITKIGLATALFPLFTALPAHAALFDNVGGDGNLFEDVFFGGAFGQSEADGVCNGASECSDDDTSWKIYGGYKITDMIDAEVGYHNIGDISHTKGGSVQTSEISAFSVNAVGTYDINDSVQALGKVGAARWSSDNSDGDESGFSMTYGFGAKVSMNESMKIRAEWENISDVKTAGGHEGDVSTMSLGIEMDTL